MKLKNIIMLALVSLLFAGCTDVIPVETDQDGNLLVNLTDEPIEVIDPDFFLPTNIQFLNPTYGEEMNIDASFSGTPQLIYNENVGTPTEWDATTIVGTWDFASNVEVYDGLVSIDGTGTSTGDIMQLNNGAITTSTTITGWIYVTAWSELWNNHLLLYAYNLSTATTTGIEVNIEDYINTNQLNTWQMFNIPYDDLNVTAEDIDSFRIRVESDTPSTKAPNFYLDLIQLQESGGEVYIARPFPNSWFYTTHVKVQLCDNLDTTEVDATMPRLNYSRLMDIPELEQPIVVLVTINGNTIEAFSIRNIKDYLFIGESTITNYVSYDSDTMITMTIKFDKPLVLKSENGDKQEVIISSNLEGLDCFRSTLAGYTVFK
jgi:hypothetical protein